MARYHFKQAVVLRNGPAGHGGKHLSFSKGVHEVDDKTKHKVKFQKGDKVETQEMTILDHPTFKHYAKHGLIEPYKAPEQKELEPASGDIAKGAAAAKAGPDEEIGGDDEPSKGKKKGK